MKFTHWFVQLLLSSPKFLGRDFLIVKVPRWLLKKPDGKVTINTRFGFAIQLHPLEDLNIENVIYERGVYELGTVQLVKSFLSPGCLFVDVGANIGFLSMVGAKQVGEQGKVIAFEPVPSTFDILSSNIQLNKLHQVKLEPYALGSKPSTATIYSEPDNRGGASIANQRSAQGIEIEVKRLDDFDFEQKVDLVKIDVEGYEFEVLKGAEQLIKKDQPKMIIEFSMGRKNEGDSMEMLQWIKNLNLYDIYRLKDGKERRSKLVNVLSKTVGLPEHDNIICLPRIK